MREAEIIRRRDGIPCEQENRDQKQDQQNKEHRKDSDIRQQPLFGKAVFHVLLSVFLPCSTGAAIRSSMGIRQ